MGVTRLKRKTRYNKTVSTLKKQQRKLQTKVIYTASPVKDQSGVIIDNE